MARKIPESIKRRIRERLSAGDDWQDIAVDELRNLIPITSDDRDLGAAYEIIRNLDE